MALCFKLTEVEDEIVVSRYKLNLIIEIGKKQSVGYWFAALI